ncbi:MAG: hypothetical protein IM638_19160 [Bacteroidetes bacterium]|nr:hypothetical protein [Bacteroidota bacterium]
MPAPDTRKYQGLITTGIVVGALLLLFIAGSAAILSIAATTQRMANDVQQDMLDAQLGISDSIDESEQADEVVKNGETIDYSMVYTEEALHDRCEINQLEQYNLREKFSNPAQPDALDKVNELNNETKRVYEMLNKFRRGLNDTMMRTGDYGNQALTAAYFNTDNRSKYILKELKNYRDKMVVQAKVFNPADQSSPQNSLPLNDIPSKNQTGVWDESKFYDTPENAIQYLLELQFAVKYFEYDVLMIYSN